MFIKIYNCINITEKYSEKKFNLRINQKSYIQNNKKSSSVTIAKLNLVKKTTF